MILKNKQITNSKFDFLEFLIKPNEATVALPTIPSVDIDESIDTFLRHPPLAPLASSETFSDVAALSHDEQSKEDIKTLSTNNENKSSKTTKHEFDSLEVLFDFPSSGISSDMHLEIGNTTQNSNHIRFSDANQIISTNKVLKFFFYQISINILLFFSYSGRKKFTN